MKRLFTFAIIATMIASFTFAQAPATVKKATPKKIEKVADTKAMAKKAHDAKVLKAETAEKVAAADVKGSSLFRTSKKDDGRSLRGSMKPLQVTGLTNLKFAKNNGFGARRATEQDGDLTITKDDNGIIIGVTGAESKFYTRSDQGTAYFVSGQSMYYDAQSGMVEVVENGNSVYIKDPITHYTQGSWVKGVKDGDNIKVATRQPLAYSASYGTTISLRWGVVDTSGKISAADDHADEFVFAVADDTWTLQGTESFENATGDAYYMGAFWDDDNSSTGYGDAETVLTYDASFVAPSTDLVELPDGVTPEDWYFCGNMVESTKTTKIKNQPVAVAFDGDDIYVQGISEEFPNAWIKGTNDNGVVTFEKLQFVGDYQGINIWAVGLEGGDLVDMTAAYDTELKTITFNETILMNGAFDRAYYLEKFEDVVLSATKAEIIEPIITELTGELPYNNGFDSDADFDQVGIYDANDDGSTIYLKDGSLCYQYNSSNAADDYAVFPGLPLEAGKNYVISVESKVQGASFPEQFELVAGKVAKASELNIPVIPETEINNTEFEVFQNDAFSVEESGVYYFAIHVTSDADQFRIYFDNFSVKAEDPLAPKPVDDLAVAPAEDGSLQATVSFTVPSETVGGTALTGDLDVIVTRDGVEIMNEKKAAGSAVEFVDVVPMIENYYYTVYVKDGEHVSDITKLTAYIGEDIPYMVTNIKVVDQTSKIHVSWDAPTEGENEGIIVVENLTYNVYPVVMEEFFGFLFPEVDYDNPYETGLEATEVDIDFNTMEGEPGWVYIAVTAENEAGEGEPAMGSFFAGAPYELPYVESLAGGQLTSWIGMTMDDESYDNGGNVVANKEDSSDDDGACFALVDDVEGWVQLETAKLALDGAVNPVLVFDVCKEGDATNLEVIVDSPDGATTLKTVTPGAEWGTETISLLDYKDAAWIRIYLKGNFTGEGSINIDRIKVYNQVGKNLAALSIKAPAKVNAGDEVKVTVTVENQGTEAVAAADYNVDLFCNEEKVEVKEGVAIESDAKTTFEFTVPTTILSPETLTFKAVVNYQADEDQANNATSEVSTKVAASKLPAPQNLTGTCEDGAIVLAWDEPSLEGGGEPVTEDFENAESFSDEYGDWTFVDKDGAPLGNVGGGGVPCITTGSTTGSYFVFDTEEFPNGWEAHSGIKCLFTMFAYNQAAQSDWAISPELSGDAQTVSFYACTPNAQYGNEVFEVYYSTGSLDPADFVKVSGPTEAPGAWTEFTADLPAGAKYFAIVCVSQDIFVFMVDDVTYTPAGASSQDLQLEGYNVYRDGVKINDALVQGNTYADASVEEGKEYSYVVTAVFTEKGESAPSNEVVLEYKQDSVNGLEAGKLGIFAAAKSIVINNAEGLDVTIVTVDGAKVYEGAGKQKAVISVAPGVYVVKAGKEARKLIVK